MRVDRPRPGEELNTGEVTEARVAASVIVLRDSPTTVPRCCWSSATPSRASWAARGCSPAARVDEDAGDELRTAPCASSRRRPASARRTTASWCRFSRWITPAQVKVRFDTWFFVARAPDGAEAEVDGSECVDARWLRPQDALDAGERDELMLVFPTIKHLEQLAEFSRSTTRSTTRARAQGHAGRAARPGRRRRRAGPAAGRARLRRLT